MRHFLPIFSAALLPLAFIPAAQAGDSVATPPANHLAGQHSPYLLQHLHNPVDWYPWGEEAFAKARSENKPIFLSVGYSTCHWCHVMERDCFVNTEVAALLNASFVCIKVDREERPDIDRLYMNFLQASTGGGGWPMSVWLSPDLKPFFGGSYFPADDQAGRPGFKTVLKRIANLWATDPERIKTQAGQMLEALAADARGGANQALDISAWRDNAIREIQRLYDPVNGGFEKAPKFPNAVFLNLLLDYQAQDGDSGLRDAARTMALTTLRKIVESGLRDHLGGGFHRYSVDDHWRLPHFEKMLCDQALLTSACLDAWLVSGDLQFRQAAEECLTYLETRMRDPGGAFYTAEDADSPESTVEGPRREGAYYVWTAAELHTVLGEKAARVFSHAFGILPEGNLSADAEGEFFGKNLPFHAHTNAETAAALGLKLPETEAILGAALDRLREARRKRPTVNRDDKILCAWNGLALSAFSKAALHDPSPLWSTTAVKLAEFIRANLYDPASGHLSRTWRKGQKGPEGFAEDYSFLIQGLLDLFECSQESRWLEWAIALQNKQDALFHDDKNGGYFATVADDPHLLIRMKSANDGAEPSANSVALKNKARLAGLLHQPERLQSASTDAKAFSVTLRDLPTALPQMLASLGWLHGTPQQVIIVGKPGEAATEALLAEIRKRHLPRLSLIVLYEGNRAFFESQSSFFSALPKRVEGQPLAFLCENFVCQLPCKTAADFGRLLDRAPKRSSAEPK
jgi:uncharacterized protein